jgi:hypothetical protein
MMEAISKMGAVSMGTSRAESISVVEDISKMGGRF